MEKNEESKIINYCIIALIIIIAIILILGIQMIDFSNEGKEEQISITEVETNTIKKLREVNSNNNQVDSIKNIVTTGLEQKNVSNMVENKVVGDNGSIEDALNELNKLSQGTDAYIIGNKIVIFKEDIVEVYVEFDENDKFVGIFEEVHCRNYFEVEFYSNFFDELGMKIEVDGKNVRAEQPVSEETRGLSRDVIEQRIREEYVLHYEE